MISARPFLGVLVTFALLLTPIVHAQGKDENMATMAEIMANLNHYPSDEEKQTLREIADDPQASQYEKTLADAMINLEHTAAAEDKPKLEEIMQDQSAPESARTLAAVIHDFNHKPTSADIAALEKISK